jgi:alpha-D-ribose 1-methylphosphonate 5-triphosphate diphosphatase PhnM
MALDLLLRQARRTEDIETLVDIAIADGPIVDIAQRISADAPAEDVDGRLVIAGFVAHPRMRKRCSSPALPKPWAQRASNVQCARELSPPGPLP